jgi:pyruvate/2-oxoglutarate dehydrogenase complex dihydrolipoamide dehydrogenase (E3) component
VKEAARFGTTVESVRLDWPTVIARQHAVIEELRPRPETLERAGVVVTLGEAKFTDPHSVAVNGSVVWGEKIVIAAGSAAVLPDIPGIETAITSDEILVLPRFPRRLIMIGAGVIGLEMAAAFSDLGAEVTVIGQDREILPGFDGDVAAYLRQILEHRGVTFHLGATVTHLSGTRGAVTAQFTQGGARHEVTAEQACVAVGRRWRPQTLGAEALGLALGRTGLAVTPYLRTSVPHIYAAGDAAGRSQLTPVAAYEGRLAARNALEGDRTMVDERVVPQTVFTTPEIARVGLTHREAQASGVRCHVATHDMRGSSNGRATGEDDGYLKLVFDGADERLLGVQMVSYAAAELVQMAALAIRAGVTGPTLAAQLSVHPTHGERFIKVAGHDHHDVCEIPDVPMTPRTPGRDPA